MQYIYISNTDLHIFGKNLTKAGGLTISLSSEQLEELIFDYVSEGRGLTISACADKHQLSQDDIRLVFSCYPTKITKEAAPFTISQMELVAHDVLAKRHLAKLKSSVKAEMDKQQIAVAEAQNKAKARVELELENLRNVIETNVPKLDLNLNLKKASKNTSRCLVYHFADWHIGAKNKKNAFAREFNIEVATDRVGQLCSQIEKTPDEKMDVTICFMGDLVDGPMGMNRPGHGNELELVGWEQIKRAAELAIHVVKTVVKHHTNATSFTLHSVSGNHDRVSPHTSVDTERLANVMIQYMIKEACSKLPIEFHNATVGPQAFNVTPNIRHLILHGDSKWNANKLIKMDMQEGAKLKFITVGHEHTKYIEEDTQLVVNKCPSLMANSKYINGDLCTIKVPCQQAVLFMEDIKTGQVAFDVSYFNLF